MVALATCALLFVGAALFAVAVLRFVWYGALVLWRTLLQVASAIVQRLTNRDIS